MVSGETLYLSMKRLVRSSLLRFVRCWRLNAALAMNKGTVEIGNSKSSCDQFMIARPSSVSPGFQTTYKPHVAKLACLGWMITLRVVFEFEKLYSRVLEGVGNI